MVSFFDGRGLWWDIFGWGTGMGLGGVMVTFLSIVLPLRLSPKQARSGRIAAPQQGARCAFDIEDTLEDVE